MSNTKLTGQNTTAEVNNASSYTMVQFDLSWENYWLTSSEPDYWDAALVFVKCLGGIGDGQHIILNNTVQSGKNI